MIGFALLIASAIVWQNDKSDAAPPGTAMQAAAAYSQAHSGQTMIVMFDGKNRLRARDGPFWRLCVATSKRAAIVATLWTGCHNVYPDKR